MRCSHLLDVRIRYQRVPLPGLEVLLRKVENWVLSSQLHWYIDIPLFSRIEQGLIFII